jgi:uncharacterized membrane protein
MDDAEGAAEPGLRRPDLGCPDRWRTANRVGGRWLMGAGVVSLLAAPLPAPWPVGVMLIAILAACVASLVAPSRAP